MTEIKGWPQRIKLPAPAHKIAKAMQEEIAELRAALAKSQPARGPCPIAKALAALEVAQDNLRPHGDNCFLHDEGEYSSCFCGKDSLSNYLQEVVEELSDQAYQPVAWQHCQRSGPDAEWQEWHTVGYKPQGPESAQFKMRPLFTHPARPMSDKQREFMRHKFNQRNFPVNKEDFREYVRAVEAFHGIKGATE